MKKQNQQKLNKMLTASVLALGLYSIIFTWFSANAYFEIKRSLEHLYLNVSFDKQGQ